MSFYVLNRINIWFVDNELAVNMTNTDFVLIERRSVTSRYHGRKISGSQQQGVFQRRRRTAKKQ